MEKIYKAISELGKQYKASRIILFGSRARGDNREKSDIDIAVFKMPKENQLPFSHEIEKLPTLLTFDIVFVSETTSDALIQNIKKDGVIIMDKFQEKLSKFSDALVKLGDALSEYEKYKISSSRDGAIQRFELCTELAWKTTREYLISQGYVDINSPKSVMQQAFADGLISDEQEWLELLYSRNLTSHIYDENIANEIFENIKNKYLSLFRQLEEQLNK